MPPKKTTRNTTGVLQYAASDTSANQLYFSRISVPDPFLSFGFNGKRYAVVNALEYGRVSRDAVFDEVYRMEEWLELARKRFRKVERPGVVELVRIAAKEHGIKRFQVAYDFPTGLAQKLEKAGVRLDVVEEELFPERECKTAEEAAMIKRANAASAAGLKAAEIVLRKSTIKGKFLMYQGKRLTSERLRQAVDIACLENGAVATSTIAAGGDQACDPHCVGSGPLKANEMIIVDVFPRDTQTGYHGDMTRTFLKGKASDRQVELYNAVFKAQQEALNAIKARKNGRTLFEQTRNIFNESGFPTEVRDGVNVGFFHGLGHGLGLEVHEPPRVSSVDQILKSGHVVTVEPGLYYPSLGGCRIEDVALVTNDGMEMLSKFHYNWQIK